MFYCIFDNTSTHMIHTWNNTIIYYIVILFFKFILIFIIFFSEDHKLLAPNVQEVMLFYEYPLFIYPHLLPTRTFCHHSKPSPMELSEEKYLQSICLVQSKYMGFIN